MIVSLSPMKFDNKKKIIKIIGRGATIKPDIAYFFGTSGIKYSNRPQKKQRNTIPKLNSAPATIWIMGAACIVNIPPNVKLIAVNNPEMRTKWFNKSNLLTPFFPLFLKYLAKYMKKSASKTPDNARAILKIVKKFIRGERANPIKIIIKINPVPKKAK